jgi:serine/threonine-protein phosphatase 2B catalytic subunit
MDAGDEQVSPNQEEQQRNAHVDNAIRAIRQKKPVPEIDFTIHTMEDGTQVNTTERVCKGIHSPAAYPAIVCTYYIDSE